MELLSYLQDHIVVLDGAMGTQLQAAGLAPGEIPETWNLRHPDEIEAIHRRYLEAGSNIVLTNTFGANGLKFSGQELRDVVEAGVGCARAAAEANGSGWVALDIGPSGRMLAPYGDLAFEEAVSLFSQVAAIGAKAGADLVMIETMNDSYETKAALLGVKEACDLPVFVSNAYGEDGKLMTGATPAAMVALLEGMGADAIGVNCSFGPEALTPVVEEYLRCASVPVLMKPNAGMPKVVDGETVYDVGPEEFSESVAALIPKGLRIVGGCCGTTPDYIRALGTKIAGTDPQPLTDKGITAISSYAGAICFGGKPVLIGERINPTGKKRFQQALRDHEINYILNEAIAQQAAGAHALDVNVGLPEIDEPAMMEEVVAQIQTVTDLPLQIDTSDPVAMERALRVYNGKALVNSVNGKREVMEQVFPLVKKYGGVVIALTLDEKGIPETAEERLEIAHRILDVAAGYGIAKKDIIFDTLTMTISADGQAAVTTLRAMEEIAAQTGCHTSLGVSNVSFGLPQRPKVNAAFFLMALTKGLSAAIINPKAFAMMRAYHLYNALAGGDPDCAAWIDYAGRMEEQFAGTGKPAAKSAPGTAAAATNTGEQDLRYCIVKGMREQAAQMTAELLADREPLDIIEKEVIPALDQVGTDFEQNRIYLPQLLMSAESAEAAFSKVKAAMAAGSQEQEKRCTVVIATVKGDIHDIGKNIVKLLLENYGFDVIDLGKDVAPENVVGEVKRTHAPLAGLSALMTTTVPAMEETIKLMRQEAPWCKVMVGGAVLTQEYADAIGADSYGRDAMEAVRYAKEIDDAQHS